MAGALPLSALPLGGLLLHISHHCTQNPYCDLQCQLCSLLILFPRLEELWKGPIWISTICCHLLPLKYLFLKVSESNGAGHSGWLIASYLPFEKLEFSYTMSTVTFRFEGQGDVLRSGRQRERSVTQITRSLALSSSGPAHSVQSCQVCLKH